MPFPCHAEVVLGASVSVVVEVVVTVVDLAVEVVVVVPWIVDVDV